MRVLHGEASNELSYYLHDTASGVLVSPPVPFLFLSEFPVGTTGPAFVFFHLLFCFPAWPGLPDACAPLF